MDREDARKLSPEAQHERRRQVVSAYKRGVNRGRIARNLGLSYTAARLIVDRFKQDGMRGIESGRRGRRAGSCRTFAPEQEERIQRTICDKRPDRLKLDFALRTRRCHAFDRARVWHSHPGAQRRRVSQTLGFTPQRPIRRAYEKPPVAVKKWLNEHVEQIESLHSRPIAWRCAALQASLPPNWRDFAQHRCPWRFR